MIVSVACDTFSFGGPAEGPYVEEPGKALAVTTQTFGIGMDGIFSVEMTSPDGRPLLNITVPSNGTQVERWTDDAPDGDHSVYLIPESFTALVGTTVANCTVRGQNPRVVAIAAGADTARTTFDVDCQIP